MIFSSKKSDAVSAQPKQRSVLGLLFKPQLGPAFSPMRESSRHFLQLLAMVFSIYGLLPKTYPGLRDETVRMSLRGVIGDAWRNVEFTREGAPRAILFFAVIGMMGFSACAIVFSLLALLSGQAHAAPTTDAFAPVGSNDLAQNWLNYLFNSGSFPTASDTYGDATSNLEDPFAGSVSLQNALISALAFYSDAILIVAAIILFYHLTAMVVETAHHGVPMGKRASQIWAPIRLVFAIGLLVPVNGGLNCGQFIVIKIAEVGSAMASNGWALFLHQLASYSGQPVPPVGEMGGKIAHDIIHMKACKNAWNWHLKQEVDSSLPAFADALISDTPTPLKTSLGATPGILYTYTSNSLATKNICGSYFVPSGANLNGSGNSGTLLSQSAQIQIDALSGADSAFELAATDMNNFLNSTVSGGAPFQYTPNVTNAVIAYQKALDKSMADLALSQKNVVSQAIEKITPYGWVMAGAFLNAVDRIQADLSSAGRDTMPTTTPPQLQVRDRFHEENTLYFSSQVATDMMNFDAFQVSAIQQTASSTDTDSAACAAMVGLGIPTQDTYGSSLIDELFKIIDTLAVHSGVWTSGNGSSCAGAHGASTFKLGVQIGGRDPFAQMAALGYANLNTAFELVAFGAGADFMAAMGKNHAAAISDQGKSLLGDLGKAAAAIGPVFGGILMFAALIFFVCGFTLAFLVPLMPFMRFFFAVVSWVAGIVEAVIAVPLVALAHLNPEGEGLPGQSAKGAYFFIFNLFLRPLLTVFGLICGLVMFLISVSFLNYGYAVAVSGIGASTYGLASMAKLIYSVLYVAILYISANHCFMMIDHIPENALKWMGASGQAMPKMGDADKVEQYGTIAAGYVGQQGMGKLGDAAKNVGGLAGNFSGNLQHAISDRIKRGRDAEPFAGGINNGDAENITKLAVDNGKSISETVKNKPLMNSLLGRDLDAGQEDDIIEKLNDSGMYKKALITKKK